MLPFVRYFVSKNVALLIRQAFLCLEVIWVLSCDRTVLEERENIFHFPLTGELLDIGHKLIFWYAEQRILDPGMKDRLSVCSLVGDKRIRTSRRHSS